MRVSNPLLESEMFSTHPAVEISGERMSINGALAKTVMLAWLMGLTFIGAWYRTDGNPRVAAGLAGAGMICALVFGLISYLRKEWAQVTAPIFASCLGMMFGGISANYAAKTDGLAGIALVGTITALIALVWIYRFRVFPRSASFRNAAGGMVGGAFFLYLVTFAIRPLDLGIPLLIMGNLNGIIVCLLLVALASLSVADALETVTANEETNAPAHMEWYIAFGLIATLVWMYVSCVRLLPLHYLRPSHHHQ